MIINNITKLFPVKVANVIAPKSIDEICNVIRSHTGLISIGGGYYSMGGQTAVESSLHLDMRQLNKIIEFNSQEKYIRVEAGVCWHNIQELIDQYDLSIKIMQSYANFTVGGSLSVNVHGRYVGLGPIILSVREIKLVLADGRLISASPKLNSQLFFGAIGGYGGLGVIVEATLDLVSNVKLERHDIKLKIQDYYRYFSTNVINSNNAVFHNADLYSPTYTKARAVTFIASDKQVTRKERLVPIKKHYPIFRYFIWAVSETPLGKWRREYLFDPFYYLRKTVVWRNHEASHIVEELEPYSRHKATYVLQEYFVPVQCIEQFIPVMASILNRYKVNVLNISIRHAFPDSGSILAWAKEEVFALVLYYKQYISEAEQHKVAIWTRELINAALSFQGSYYLPYQIHATPEQFYLAYPRAKEFFNLKRQFDPDYKFGNKLWEKYYLENDKVLNKKERALNDNNSEFKAIFSDTVWRDRFYLFLQNIFHLYPENEFHFLIAKACEQYSDDQAIYEYVQAQLPSIKPFLSEVFYALPALKKQKHDMAKQTAQLLGSVPAIKGYIEIGTTGRYIKPISKFIKIEGPIYLINDQAPSNSPIDIAERGSIAKLGTFVPLNNYDAIPELTIGTHSVDLVTCFIGLHHVSRQKLNTFLASVYRVLKSGGKFIVRDHNADMPMMRKFVSLAHTVYNLGIGVSWKNNQAEERYFISTKELIKILEANGSAYTHKALLQSYDPTSNTLMEFVKK